MDREKPLTTADVARADADVRGRGEERFVGREDAAVLDAPPATERRDQANAVKQAEVVESEAARRDAARDDGHVALFAGTDASDFHRRWTDIQTGFVDEPRNAVEQADSLVAEVMKTLAEGFANERAALERQWDRGDNVTTEDLRIALQKYRSFFDRLLKI